MAATSPSEHTEDQFTPYLLVRICNPERLVGNRKLQFSDRQRKISVR